jgi:hypothetical protein
MAVSLLKYISEIRSYEIENYDEVYIFFINRHTENAVPTLSLSLLLLSPCVCHLHIMLAYLGGDELSFCFNYL